MYRISDIGAGGISSDLPDRDTPPNMVNIANNVVADGKTLRVNYGYQKLFDAPEPMIHLQAVDDARDPRVMLLLSETHAYNWNGSTITDITTNELIPPSEGDRWSSDQIGGMAIFAHHADAPHAWSPPGDGVEQYLPWDADNTWKDKSFTAGVIANYKNFIVAAHIDASGTESPRLVKWSSSVTDTYTLPYWEPLPENDAGSVLLEDIGTGVKDMAPLGDNLILYGNETAYLMQYVGGAYVMRFQKLDSIPGVLAKGLVMPVLNSHFVVGQTDVYLHSGGAAQTLVDGKIRRTLYETLNADTTGKVFLVKNWELSEIWICFSEKDHAYAWSWEHNTWTIRQLEKGTIHGESGVTPACGDVDNPCFTWDTVPYESWGAWGSDTWNGIGGNLADTPEMLFSLDCACLVQRNNGYGDFMPSTVERIGLDIGEYENQFTILHCYPAIEKAQALVQVGVQMTEGAPVQWSKAQMFTPGIDKKLDVRVDNLTGSLFSYRVYSEVASQWEFSGMEVVFVEAGRD